MEIGEVIFGIVLLIVSAYILTILKDEEEPQQESQQEFKPLKTKKRRVNCEDIRPIVENAPNSILRSELLDILNSDNCSINKIMNILREVEDPLKDDIINIMKG